MKKITVESGIKIKLPNFAVIEIWESCGDWLVDIKDSECSVQIKTTEDSDGRSFNYYNKCVLNKINPNGEK